MRNFESDGGKESKFPIGAIRGMMSEKERKDRQNRRFSASEADGRTNHVIPGKVAQSSLT
jgi:hypothetical protein